MYGMFVHVLLSTHIHTKTTIHTHTSQFDCVCVCVCVFVCVRVCVFVRVLLSNKYHIERCFSNFFHHCPHKLTVLLLKLSWRFLRWIQKVAQMGFCLNSRFIKVNYMTKGQQKEHLFRFNMIPNTHTFSTKIIYLNNIPDCTMFYTDCIPNQIKRGFHQI